MSGDHLVVATIHRKAFDGPWDPPARTTKPAFDDAKAIRAACDLEVERIRERIAALLAAARKGVRRILENASFASDAVRDRARTDGFAEGAAMVRKVLDVLERETLRRRTEFDAVVTERALQIAREVLRNELTADPSHVIGLALRGLGAANRKARSEVTVRVHADDVSVLTAALDRLRASAPNIESIRVVASEEVSRHDVYVDVDRGAGYRESLMQDLEDLAILMGIGSSKPEMEAAP